MSSGKFKIKSNFSPAGDQPQAIEALAEGIKKGLRHQVLLGVTGSGKTFTVANVIEKLQKPTLVIAHNKTLAAQLAQEYREFFPDNAVHYFVSYYDFYQPEAYLPITDTYIEKEAQINEEIDRLRHASTQALLTRRDVIIVASVSCIYGLGSPVEYEKVHIRLEKGMKADRAEIIRRLVGVYFERTSADLSPGLFRALGNTIEIMPTNEKVIYRLSLEEGAVSRIEKIDALSREIIEEQKSLFLFPAKHYVTPEKERARALSDIKRELDEQLKKLHDAGKLLEAERLKRRTNYDLALIREIGYTNGIENYSRHFDGRKVGEPPYTLLSYFPHSKDGKPDFLTVIDESHVTVPQIGGMYAGDYSRKKNLVEHGFRLPSAVDNRPLTFEEFEERVGQVLYTSATPGEYEIEKSKRGGRIVEQVIRPTGLVDPEIIVKPVTGSSENKAKTSGKDGRSPDASHAEAYRGQIKDFIDEAEATIQRGGRVMVTTLTKKMAEDLAEFLKERGLKAEYLHSDIETIDRITILTEFRKGSAKGGFDCLVGVNLLREGLDLPEVELVAILDADKEGFLRSETSLIQTIGRAARNIAGRVILYADIMTGSMERAIGETHRRRARQTEYNRKHGITPKTIIKNIRDITDQLRSEHERAVGELAHIDEVEFRKNPRKMIAEKKKQMNEAVKVLDFETAALLRDEIRALQGLPSLSKKAEKA